MYGGSWPEIPAALTEVTEEAQAVVEDHELKAHVWRGQEERPSAPPMRMGVMQAGGRAPQHQVFMYGGSWPEIPAALTEETEEARAVVEDHEPSAHVWRGQEERPSAPPMRMGVTQAGGRAP